MDIEERVDVKTISLPPDVWQQIDTIKDEWDGNRSKAILRIFKEWRTLKAQQDELLASLRQKLMTEADTPTETTLTLAA